MKNYSIQALTTLMVILVLPSQILIWGACPPLTSTTIEDRLLDYAKDLLKGEEPTKYPKMDPSGRFPDLRYGSENDFKVHGTRLGAIFLKDINAGNPFAPEAIASIDYLADPTKTQSLTSSNWWDHVIGVPEKMWAPIFLARNDVTPQVKTKYIERYFTQTKKGPVWDLSDKTGKMAGGNMAPRLFLALVVNFLEDNLCNFNQEAKSVLEREVIKRQPYDGEGLRQDGCLHQHNLIWKRAAPGGGVERYVYSMIYFNYGKEFLRNAARVMWILDDSDYDLGDDIELAIFASFLECQQWLYKHYTVDPSSTGRFIDSGSRVTKYVGKDGVQEPLKYFLRVNHNRSEIEAANRRYEDKTPDPMYALEGNRHFFVSDMMAHQRSRYMSTLRLLSTRTVRPETSPRTRENNKGYFEGDGFLSVMVTGDEFGTFENEVFQVYDWARIPGVSCHYTTIIPEKETIYVRERMHAFNNADFVGGVSNDREGFATMVYKRPSVPLNARKSWFFTDSVILCIGSDISLPPSAVDNEPVITTLNQVVYVGSHAAWEANNSPTTSPTAVTQKIEQEFDMLNKPRFHHDSVGYVPLKHNGKVRQQLDIRRHNRPKAQDILTYSLWLDHGQQPLNAEYVYAILPGRSDIETENFAKNPTVQSLMTSSQLHAAISLAPHKVLGAAFFVSGCLDGSFFDPNFAQICVDTPALLLVKEMPPNAPNCQDVPNQLAKPSSLSIKLQISIADPTQMKTRISLKIGKWFSNTFYLLPTPLSGKSIINCFKI